MSPRKSDDKTDFDKDFSLEAPIPRDPNPESDFKGIIDEGKLFKKIIDDRKNSLDHTLPFVFKIVKEIGHDNPSQKLFSKYKIFIKIMEYLEDKNTMLVDVDLLTNALEKTGVFSRIKARSYITRMYRERIIEEPKSGFFRLL